MIQIKNKKLTKLLDSGGRKGAREDFFELLKRSLRYKKLIKKKK
jgi:hypothetical protein